MEAEIKTCKLCLFGSKVFGHGLTYLLGKKYDKVLIGQVDPCLVNLNLVVVGGLKNWGYTEHDIDVVGNKKDIPLLIQRLTKNKIDNLVHYRGLLGDKHSHLTALVNGFLVTFFGNRIYF